LSALNESNAKYLVVGGYAVMVHSEPRATKDLDVFIRSDPENAAAVFKALVKFGAPVAGLSPADFSDGVSYFQMGNPPHRVDVLQTISGVSFDESWDCHVSAIVNGQIEVPVISVGKLIENKLAAGRLRDLADVDVLKKALRSGMEKG
jgi:hypothetical protein